MVQPYWAHSKNDAGRRHRLVDHLRSTAELAACFADPFGGDQVAWWLGLLHDVGKASCSWQEGLVRAEVDRGPVNIDHKTLGARLAFERGLGKYALAIDGHHGGLGSPPALANRLKSLTPADRERHADAEAALGWLVPELAQAGAVELPTWWVDPLVGEMALRLVFSALCDADFLDTAAHFAGKPGPVVQEDADFAVLHARFEAARSRLLASRPAAPVDVVREDVYRACLTAASAPPGVFRLAAPTGSGKTLASAGFGLQHAAANGLRRVVVAVPFMTITEQNAAVYRGLLDAGGEGRTVVLEHHSGVELNDNRPGDRWARLAAENWDAPFVVTTTVRLFESLFGRRPAAMRRVHRLVRAVIVLDEVQALPHRLLVPILDGLRLLVTHFGTTVLLASATQPDFWELSPFRDLPATEIMPDPPALIARLRRVRFEWRIDPSPTLDEVADDAATCVQAMVVVNTTADAARVFARWRDAVPAGVAWHLSTRMCPAHRRRILVRVRERLARGAETLLVSTQLIEAGVDIDVPVVYRALAPADSLLQAAGRANREGNLADPGRVIIVDPPDAGAPPAYRTPVGETRVHFGPGKADPDALGALGDYYRSLYTVLNLEHHTHPGQQIQEARRHFDFPAVADGPLRDAGDERSARDRRLAFRMILDDGIAVITPDGAETEKEQQQVRELLDQLRAAPRPQLAALRQLQPFVTNLPRSALRRPGVAALLRPVVGELGAAGSVAEWIGDYDTHTGITVDPAIEEYVQ
jgi:CRISPR-associated helicase Cas3/CRISPR-associated endonuclease Cas3-HD